MRTPTEIPETDAVKRYAFGVDLGGTTAKIGFFDAAGTLLDKWEIPTRKENGGEQILPDISRSLKDYVQEKQIALQELIGIGIDVPGAVLSGGIVNRCANMGWGVRPVAKELSDLFGGEVPVRVANDANAAALGEMSTSKDVRNIVMVTLGTGVGGGVVLDGEIVTGAFGAGGEIGHMPVNPHETETCGCGKCGCLEQYTSATGIVRVAKKKLQSTDRPSLLREEEITAKTVFDAAREGDEVAGEIVEYVCAYLGRALASIAAVVDPEAFVIGGGVSRAGAVLLDTVQKYYRKYAFHASRDTVIRLAELGNDAGMYGAVQMVLPQTADA